MLARCLCWRAAIYPFKTIKSGAWTHISQGWSVTDRPSVGLTAKIDAAALKIAERHARELAKGNKPSRAEQIVGGVLLGVWCLFLIGEYFHIVGHREGFQHLLTKWSPLFVGLALLSRTAFHRIADLLVKLKGLRIVSKGD